MTKEQKNLKKRFLYRLKHLKYFDNNFSMKKVAVQLISPKDFREHKRFQSELVVVRKILTLIRYKQLPLTYDIEENPNKIITQYEFKNFVINKERNRSFAGDKEIEGIECQYMTKEEFEVLEKTFKLV